MFFTFHQNNSYGKFNFSSNYGLYVIIEAGSSKEANNIAEKKGLYFDGCREEIDCPCCGDRWSKASDFSGEEEPLIYGKPPIEALGYSRYYLKNPNDYFCVIHYKNGAVQRFTFSKVQDKLISV